MLSYRYHLNQVPPGEMLIKESRIYIYGTILGIVFAPLTASGTTQHFEVRAYYFRTPLTLPYILVKIWQTNTQ